MLLDHGAECGCGCCEFAVMCCECTVNMNVIVSAKARLVTSWEGEVVRVWSRGGEGNVSIRRVSQSLQGRILWYVLVPGRLMSVGFWINDKARLELEFAV